jgi:hypothetical protein
MLKVEEAFRAQKFLKRFFFSNFNRKYIFNCLEDMGQVNVPTDLERGELLVSIL